MNVWEGVEAHKEAQTFCEMWGVEGPVLVDEDEQMVHRLGIRGVPTNVLVDDDGTITCVGASTPVELEAAVLRLLGPGASLEDATTEDWHWQKDPEHIRDQVGSRVVRAPDGT